LTENGLRVSICNQAALQRCKYRLMKIALRPEALRRNEGFAADASEVLEVRDDRPHVLIENPPTGLRERVKLAIRLRPRQAISTHER
jgi:hypothetical protein